MLERGMSTPARTTVVASTHRVYTTREKMSGADGRFASERIIEAVGALSRRALLFDMETIRARLDGWGEWLGQKGIVFLVVVVPDKNTIYPEYLPGQIAPAIGPAVTW